MNDPRLKHVPGAKYDIKAEDKIKFPSWSQTKDARFKDDRVKNPGPGHYESRDLVSDGPKYTTRVKPFIDPRKCRTTTGPGDYDPANQSKKIFYSMSVKLDGPRKRGNPGPGTYESMHNLHYNKLPGSKMGRDNRSSYFLKDNSHKSPAPVKYN